MSHATARGNTSRHCSCGKPGTVAMVDPEYPLQRSDTVRYYFCLDCSRLCRYLIPDSEHVTQQEVDFEHQGVWARRER